MPILVALGLLAGGFLFSVTAGGWFLSCWDWWHGSVHFWPSGCCSAVSSWEGCDDWSGRNLSGHLPR